MTWSEAQQHCRDSDKYDDLATFENIGGDAGGGGGGGNGNGNGGGGGGGSGDGSWVDMHSFIILEDFPVWIGLHRDGGTWNWSIGSSEYDNWDQGEPSDSGDCVSISSSEKKMSARNCTIRLPFVCMNDNLILVKENKTWEEALEHCRNLVVPYYYHIRYELVSVQPSDHDYVTSRVIDAETEEVWTGLRFLAGRWLWVNGADMLSSDLPTCPVEVQSCGALPKKDTGSLETRDCTEKRNFLCYQTWF
ncbi:macrophage mannose receptor 1-like protein [Lates japonicus]|uniref:Macrophage mannose receptor 1-like protein n=1 Tax=Lates japonicus TaxID=270547 RepID=A0AAD3MJ54_LATJO|nr:macrophage mannose receptor 1-like protein [Lates japonicus]